MTISPDLVMLDTNVLAYAYYEDTPQYPAASVPLSPAKKR
jgi:hypothetical protein